MKTSNMQYLNEKGFTLVEVLIAVSILTIGILGIASLSGRAAIMHGASRNTSLGVNIAQDRMESIFKIPFVSLAESNNEATTASDLQRTCVEVLAGVENVVKCTPIIPNIAVSDDWDAGTVAKASKRYDNFVWEYYVVQIDINGDGVITSDDKIKKIDVVVNWFDPMLKDRKYIVFSSYRSK